jgi:dolichyl-phosphate-mannose-protein mannosyltransferase
MGPIMAGTGLVRSGSVTLPAPLARTVGLSRTASGEVVPSAAGRARLRPSDRDPLLAWVGTMAVTLLAAFLRFWDLGKPRAFEFDETYYAKDAWSLIPRSASG